MSSTERTGARPPRRRGGISSFAIRRPIGTSMMASVVVVLGGFFLSGLPLDLLPSIVYPQIRAGVVNRGVAPEVLEETVAKPLENALATTENLIRIESEIQEGRVGINLHFRYGTNIDFALQDASKNLERVRAQLPVEADPPTIFKFDPSQAPIYEAAFSSGSMDLIQLRDWAENRLRPQLLTIEGVASIDITGGLVREIQVILDQERLRSYGLTVSQVVDAIRAQNQDIAAGRITSPMREVVGKTEGKFRSVDEIRSMLIAVPGGRIPLAEVATILDTHREQRLWARLDGVPAVRLTIRKQPDANTVVVADGVDARLRLLRQSAFIPPEVAYVVINNQADFIRNSVAAVRNAALAGATLAMVVVLLFLASLRKTFIVGLAIPMAILATFMMMGLGGLTLNIMSLGGLALGVGLLIDNSIVMLENVFRHREEGHEDPDEAAHAGAAEVQSAVVAATSTNLAAVVPFLLISGLAALIFRELILTISFAIVASLAVALTVVPMLSAQLSRVRFSTGLDRRGPLRAFDRHVVGGLRAFYRNVAPGVIRWRWAVLALGVLLLAGVGLLARGLGNEFLPNVDDGNVSVSINLPPGSSVERTNRIAMEIEEMVREMPHVQNVFTTAGGMFFGGATAEMGGRGSLTVILDPASQRRMSSEAWVQDMQARIEQRGFAGARIFVRGPRLRGLRTSAAGSDVSIAILGDDLLELQRIANDIMVRLRDVPGLTSLQPSNDEASPLLSIELDRERASFLGLNVATVGQTLRTAMDGTIATRFTDGNREYDIRVMFPRDRFQSPEDISGIALFPGGAGRSPVYVRDVASVTSRIGPSTITRENQNRLLRLNGDVSGANVGDVNAAIRARLADLQLPDGYGLIYGGEEEAIRENNRQLAIVVGLAIFLVFVVLAVQYESFINPFVIILAIPLSLIGVGTALWITNTPLSAPVLLGVILLAGIVVNNAILLVDFIEQKRRDEGLPMEQAVVEAGVVRLRPILMTTLTTAFGMLPLALGIGSGTEMMRPLAIAVVGGLTLSAFLTLFIVPSAYVILNRGAETAVRFLTGGPRAAEPRQAEAGAAGD
jgi:hydrophobe/amphiphile efflux-1 (HAE1) family protein